MDQPAKFDSEAEANEWMLAKVNDPCVDNHRFAYLDDPAAVANYEVAKARGCCGSFDCEVNVNGRMATFGCNYGH